MADDFSRRLVMVTDYISFIARTFVYFDRPNIHLSAILCDNNFDDAFGWYIEHLRNKGCTALKAIVYCR